MGENGRKAVEGNFNEVNMVDRYVNVIREIASGYVLHVLKGSYGVRGSEVSR
jgi:hypothetical protein